MYDVLDRNCGTDMTTINPYSPVCRLALRQWLDAKCMAWICMSLQLFPKW